MKNPLQTDPQTAGLYIHIPFCLKKCPYCDFYSSTDLSLMDKFTWALGREMAMRQKKSFDTVYLGGGTPSILGRRHLDAIFQSISENFRIHENHEITIETNPGSLEPDAPAFFKSLGINRISIGAQSFSDDILKFLGRIHTADDAAHSIEQARQAGFDNIGLDLIYGIPGQTVKSWIATLKQAVAHGPSHLSCYMLTFEKKTPMEIRRKQGAFEELPEERLAEMFKTGALFLESQGFFQYETSNFARTGRQSRHNLKYWSFAPYTGLGPSAHSHELGVRSWNKKSVRSYHDDLKNQRLPLAETEILSKSERMIEALYLGLRQSRGIDVAEFENMFHHDFFHLFENSVSMLTKKNLARKDPHRFALTLDGALLLDSLAGLLIHEADL